MKLRILIVSNQVRGIDGTGGLGDVAAALAKALAQTREVDVRILMPGYRCVSGVSVEDRFRSVVAADLAVPFGDRMRSARVCRHPLPVSTTEASVPCYLLCMDAFDKAADSPEQAILLARGTLEFLRFFQEFRPDVLHLNDWHTGLIPVYLETLYRRDPLLGRMATLYTTHNAGYAYQGAFPDDAFPEAPQELLQLAGLDRRLFVPLQSKSLEHQNRFNFAKGGLGFADLITTVSLTYSDEIRTPAFGGGFEQLLQERSGSLCGIVNGIDTDEWNPASDPALAPFNFSQDDPPDTVQTRKRQIRQLLRSWARNGSVPFAGVDDDTLLAAFIGRLTDQKAAILMPVLEKIAADEGVQFAILGSAHPQDEIGRQYVAGIRRMAAAHNGSLFFFEGFEIELSHLIYAAADLLLMPSVYEPCGLAQLIGLRYGTLPLVRFVGGLADTVKDVETGAGANGFGFKETVSDPFAMAAIPAAAEMLASTVGRAAFVFRNRPQRWRELIGNAMATDVSWDIPARQYLKIYQAAVRARVRSHFLSS